MSLPFRVVRTYVRYIVIGMLSVWPRSCWITTLGLNAASDPSAPAMAASSRRRYLAWSGRAKVSFGCLLK